MDRMQARHRKGAEVNRGDDTWPLDTIAVASAHDRSASVIPQRRSVRHHHRSTRSFRSPSCFKTLINLAGRPPRRIRPTEKHKYVGVVASRHTSSVAGGARSCGCLLRLTGREIVLSVCVAAK